MFHRITHSKTTGGKKNWEKENPLLTGGDSPTYIVKKEEKDKKQRFSPYKLDTKPHVDITYPEIKNPISRVTKKLVDHRQIKT